MSNQPKREPEWGCNQDHFYKAESGVDIPVIVGADGIYMWDTDGNRYIDASSGPICSNIGHANQHVANRLYQQALKLDFAYPRVARTTENRSFTERVARMAGPGFERVFMVSGGSEAVDITFKFARQYKYAIGEKQRTRIISLMPSYHGMTLGTLAASGDKAFESTFKDMAVFSEKIPAPMTFRLPVGKTVRSYEQECALALESKILAMGPDTVLAFIVEPVGGLATGCLAPSEEYFNAIRAICDRYGVILIYDEIMSGAGRTGTFLTSHRWPGAQPDLVVLGKGIGAGYVPLGMMLASATWVDELRQLTGFNFAHTANANPISCAAGAAVLDIIEQQNLMVHAERIGRYLKQGLEEIQSRYTSIGDIRGRGLLMAIEICHKRSKRQWPAEFKVLQHLRQLGLKHGLILYARRNNYGHYGDWAMITPPLTISEEQCDEYLRRLGKTIQDFESALNEAGHL